MSPPAKQLTIFVRDITDARHPINVCSLNEHGAIRFVAAATVSVTAADHVYQIDLRTGQATTLVKWSITPVPLDTEPTLSVPAERIDGYDISPDGLAIAYALFTDQNRTAVTHLVVNGSDRILATVQSPNGFSAGDAQVEFAPSGQSVAFGVSGVTGTKEGAPVQVWSLGGHLMFSSPGSNSVTWGAGDQLLFDDGTNLTRWDGTGTTSRVLAGRWRYPSMSTDRHYVAYEGTDVAVINTANGAVTHLRGANSDASFITTTLLYHRYSAHPVIGSGEARIYDMADATDVASPIDHVFSTWPRTTPPHG